MHETGAAIVHGECRGAAKAIWIEPLQAHLFFQTIYANTTGELLKFKFFDGKDVFELLAFVGVRLAFVGVRSIFLRSLPSQNWPLFGL